MEEKTYEIEIEEILQRVVEIKANSLEEAIEKVKDKYNNEDIVLDYSDYFETKFNEYNKMKPRTRYKER